MTDLKNAQSAAELTKIPVEHLLCAQSIYHALALMNPEDVLRPSHYGMLAQSVDSLKSIVLGPEEDEGDHNDDPFGDEIESHAKQQDQSTVGSGFGEKFVQFVRRFGPSGTQGA